MGKRISILFFILIIIVSSMLSACQGEKASEGERVKLLVSTDFGKELIVNKDIYINPDISVIELLEENCEIETAYGGGFVNAINGLKSGFTGKKNKKKIDWFYYVNGMLSQVGADDYCLKNNDVVIWDYHDWSSNMYLTSIVGAYPYNFINGYEGNKLKLQIRNCKGFQKESDNLIEFLNDRGIKDIEKVSLEENGLDDEDINAIVIGKWEEISKIDYLKSIYEEGDKTGIFFKIEDNIKILNQSREASRTIEKGAVITSIVKGYGSFGTIWLITGNDDELIKKAVKILYEAPEKIEGKFSVIVTSNDLINIPLIDKKQ